MTDTTKIVTVNIPTSNVSVYPAIRGSQGPEGDQGDAGPQGDTGPAGESIVVSALDSGVTGTATTDDTTAIQTMMADAWPFPNKYYFGTCVGYLISDTITLPQSSTVWGQGWQGTRFYPANGMTVPAFDMSSNPGNELRDVAVWNLGTSGSSGVPAIITGGQQQKLQNIDVRGWKGRGVDVTVQNFSTLRNVNVSSCAEDGFTVATTYTLLDGCTSNGNGGNGFTLKNSQFLNGSGILMGCVSEGNTGHGFYITGGDWELSVYGESNGGDLLHVDGTQPYNTTCTLTAAATAGDTSITITGLTKGFPAKSILRFADGNVAITTTDSSGPVINLAVALEANQSIGATATLAPEDIHPSRLPTVKLHSGTHDGNIYLHACNYDISPNFPISATITATASARQTSEPFVKGRYSTVTTSYGGGGGSRAAQGVLGMINPVLVNHLVHTANVTHPNFMDGNPSAVKKSASVPGGFYFRLGSQFQLAATSTTWKTSDLSDGDYTVMALVRDASQTASNISLVITGGSTTSFTARTNTWEWISADHTMNATTRASGTAGIAVQRLTVTSNVDVACILIVPKQQHVVLPGTWQHPTMLGSNTGLALWVDGSNNFRFKSGLPANDTDGTALGGGGGSGFASNAKVDFLDTPSTAWSGGTVAPVGAIPGALGGYYLSAGDAVQRDMEFQVGMAAGTWNFTVWYSTYLNGGNLSVVVDGTESSTFDTYTGGAGIVGSTFTVSVATDGIKTIKIRQKGTKNASSAAYYVFFSALNGYTT